MGRKIRPSGQPMVAILRLRGAAHPLQTESLRFGNTALVFDLHFQQDAASPVRKLGAVMRRLCLGDSRSPSDKVSGRASSRSPHVPTRLEN